MNSTVSVHGLSRRYHDQIALEDIDLDVEPGSIVGLLGRNGAGKTTLMRIVAGHEFASTGSVTVLGGTPSTDADVLRRMAFVREDQTYPRFRVKHALRAASWFYPCWDGNLARELVAEFDLPEKRWISRLSRGMRSALGIVIGLAARADVTIFDEPYAGLDAVARELFYQRLLADVTEHPRTVLLSTHLIDEAAGLLERIVVIDHGRLVLDAATDDLRGRTTGISGAVRAVEEFTRGRQTWDLRKIGGQAAVVVGGILDDTDRARAAALHVVLAPLSLQQVVVRAATRSEPRPEAEPQPNEAPQPQERASKWTSQ